MGRFIDDYYHIYIYIYIYFFFFFFTAVTLMVAMVTVVLKFHLSLLYFIALFHCFTGYISCAGWCGYSYLCVCVS